MCYYSFNYRGSVPARDYVWDNYLHIPHNQTAIQSYNNHTPTHQTLVGVEQHCQLRLGGNPRLTRIITYTYLHNQIAFTITQQPHTNTSKSGRLGATRSAEAAWKRQACSNLHRHLASKYQSTVQIYFLNTTKYQ